MGSLPIGVAEMLSHSDDSEEDSFESISSGDFERTRVRYCGVATGCRSSSPGCTIGVTFDSVGSVRPRCASEAMLGGAGVDGARIADSNGRVVPAVRWGRHHRRLVIALFRAGRHDHPVAVRCVSPWSDRPTPHEHNLMAIAFNEYFMEFDPCWYVPYVEDGSANSENHRVDIVRVSQPRPHRRPVPRGIA
jgi:hypothetical protein